MKPRQYRGFFIGMPIRLRLHSKTLWVIVSAMILCEKTHTQLPLENLEVESEGYPDHSKNNALPGATEKWEAVQKRNRKYYLANREKLKADAKRYREEHPGYNKEASRKRYAGLTLEQRRKEQRAARARRLEIDPDCDRRRLRERYKNDPQHRAKILAANKKWNSDNPEKYKEISRDSKRNRIAKDPVFRLRCLMATRIHQALHGELKRETTVALLGCSRERFKAHLESLFQPGMNWSNLGIGAGTWQIDHVSPIDHHDLSTLEGQKAAFSYLNTQPMWYEDHLRKSATEETGWRRNQSCSSPASA